MVLNATDCTSAETAKGVASESSPDADVFTQWIRWHIPQTGGCLWRRDALVRAGGWKEGQPCCQEHELYHRALMAGLRFRFTPTPGAVYRMLAPLEPKVEADFEAHRMSDSKVEPKIVERVSE